MRPGRPALATLAWPWARMRSRRDGSPAWSDHLPRRNDENIRGMGYDGIHLVDCLSDYSDGRFCWPISSYFHEYLEQLYWRLSTGFINVLQHSSFPVLLGVKQGEPPNIIIKLIIYGDGSNFKTQRAAEFIWSMFSFNMFLIIHFGGTNFWSIHNNCPYRNV